MAIPFLTHIDLNGNEIRNANLQNLSTPPANPTTGRVYFDTNSKLFMYYDGLNWISSKTSVDTTYAISKSDSAITLTASDGTKTTVTDSNTTYTITSDSANNRIVVTPSSGSVQYVNLGNVAFKDVATTITSTGTGLPTASVIYNYTASQLASYYTKTNTYSKTEVNDLISGVSTITFEVVETLPATPSTTAIYLVPKSGTETNNIYEEYIYVASKSKWEKIGDTSTDLTNYVNTVTVTGTGNAVTSITKSGNKITVTKGATFLTAHPTIAQSADTTTTANPNFGDTIEIPNTVKDANGHITKIHTEKIVLPTIPATVAKTYSATNPALTASGGVCMWTVTHGLNVSGISVVLKETSTGSHVYADIVETSKTQCQISFVLSSVAAGKYTVKIIG